LNVFFWCYPCHFKSSKVYRDREQLFIIKQKESELERRIQESSSKYPKRSHPSIVLQHEELDNWGDDDSVV
jgi:hypothetical protein